LLAFGLAQFLAGILLYRAYRAEWLDRDGGGATGYASFVPQAASRW
jgi:hypothetical protein